MANGLTLELTRRLPATAPVFFDHLVEPARLANWWGPKGFTVPSLDFDARPGGSYRIRMQPPEGDAFHLAGEFRAVDPPTRLAYTFRWEEPDPDDVETLVELSLHQVGDATEVRMRQGEFKTEERRELHRGGWTESFDKLEELLAHGA
jgi:uncharacterized protein YndB with AHSA1/START domain